MKIMNASRRNFLRGLGGIAGIGAAALIWPAVPGASEKKETAPGVLPVEDLMREHGVLSRILLIYEEITARIKARRDVPAGALAAAAGIVHNFIENYHEKNEENYIFPRCEKKGRLKDLVGTLRAQHEAGRRLTQFILDHADDPLFSRPDIGKQVADNIGTFTRMYRPHKAREDTVLFPAFHDIISSSEYSELGEKFEGEEHRLFGKNGFENIAAKTAGIEKLLGINDLGKFTPR
ncbi:MAG: hemerythrin domain-containing protein [Syntrophaceae bacterium]